MFVNLSKQLINKKSVSLLLFVQFTILLIISSLTCVLTVTELAWGINELLLTFWVIIFFFLIKKKLFSKSTTTHLKLNNIGHFKINAFIFLYTFLFGVFVILSCLLWIWLFSVFIEDNYNVFHVVLIEPVIWSELNFVSYFGFLLIELVMITSFTFFLNALFEKNYNFLLLIAIILAVYLLFFGNTFLHYITMEEVGQDFYPIWHINSKGRLIFNSIMVPWTSIGNWGTNIVRYAIGTNQVNTIDTHLVNNYLNLGSYLSNSYWIPLLSIPVYLFMGTTINYLRRNKLIQT